MATQHPAGGKKTTACVIGGAGFLGSFLVKHLLEKGYAVNASVRDLNNKKKISVLLELQKLGDLKIFQADLTDEGSLGAPIAGSHFVFHVATPINIVSEDPENDVIKQAVQGVLNVLKACKKAKTVKRVVYTSSTGAISVNKLNGTGIVMDENNWSDVDFFPCERPSTWGYRVSKMRSEKAALEFGKENDIDVVTCIPSIIAGPSLTPGVPSSVALTTSLITGNEMFIDGMKMIQMRSGSVPITHLEDVCLAHIFLAEKPSAAGRYICSATNSTVPELAHFLSNRYPQYNVPTDFGDFPSESKIMLSSEKLVKEGFSFRYGLEEIYDQCIEYLKAKGLLQN